MSAALIPVALPDLLTASQACNKRLPILLTGASDDLPLAFQQLWLRCVALLPAAADCLWLAAQPEQVLVEGFNYHPVGKSAQLLGQEVDVLVVDGRQALRADDLGAAIGLVRGGGLVIIMLAQPGTVFQQHIQRQFNDLAMPQWLHGQLQSGADYATRYLSSAEAVASKPVMELELPQQQQAVAALTQVAFGHRRRPVVIEAERGRGKSAALGMAAAELLQNQRSVMITAARPDMTQAVFDWAEKRLPECQRQGLTLSYAGAELRYVAPDALRHGVQPDTPEQPVLWVDEAAALPVPILTALLQQYSRVAFATTSHGYEGTGKGFELRFKPVLDKLRPQWKAMRLQQPIRWADNDPMERLLYRCLLLDVGRWAPLPEGVQTQAVEYQWLQGAELAQQPALLSQLFGLLLLAHYQTSPHDLQLLLEQDEFSVLISRQGDLLLGCVLLVAEGGEQAAMDAELAAAIRRGKRRPKGNLIPQLLLSQLGCEPALQWRGWRVVRIAVHPECQRQGLGAALLQQLQQAAESQGYDYLSSSFALTEDVLAFWRQANFTPIHLGTRLDAASGCYALAIIKPLQQPVAEQLMVYQQRLQQRLLCLLPRLWPQLELGLLPGLLSGSIAGLATEAVDVKAFIQGERSFEASLLSLQQQAVNALLNGVRLTACLTPQELNFWLQAVIRLDDWPQLQTVAQQLQPPAQGRRAMHARLQQICARVLAAASA